MLAEKQKTSTTLSVFGIGPRCRPWPPKRIFGGTPVSTKWFSEVPTNFGLPPVRCSQWHNKNGYLDQLKNSRWCILLYKI